MSFYRGPKIVTSGLYALYDAADKNSYPGSGTAWRDISGNERHGTLTNGVGYAESSIPTLTFDGVDDFVNLPFPLTQASSANTCTIFAAARLSSTSASRRQIIGSDNGGFDWGFGAGDNTQYIVFTGAGVGSAVAQDLNWHIFAVQWSQTNTRFYIDNNLVVNTSVDWDSSVASNANIGRNPGFGELWHGSISLVQIYDRVLADVEINQNFNALRGRFGI